MIQRITLVIDQDSTPVQTYWVLLNTSNIEEAIESLKLREGTNKISFVKATDNVTDQITITIQEWLKSKNLDAAIWTGLGCKFNNVASRPSIEQVISHLKGLKGESKDCAEEYIRKAPAQVKTMYRKKIEEELGWLPTNNL